MFLKVNSLIFDAMPEETYRRVGVCKAFSNFVETSCSLKPCRKAVLLPQTPTRRYADTFPLASDNAYQFDQPIG
jgi:hypothetical protein